MRTESDSIQNQRELIGAYLTRHPEITNTREFVDDGFSGSSFERPGFLRMYPLPATLLTLGLWL